MDQPTFTQLTGITLSSSQSARFDSVAELASETLEEMLGWPLDPCDWDDQYLEIGKTKDEWWNCPDVDTSDLDPADEVQGATRLFTWNPDEPYLFIDPATEIYAVKLVKDGITYRTFDTDDYSLRLQNGRETYGRYIQFCDSFWRWWSPVWSRPAVVSLLGSGRRADGDYLQVAIDADWAFDDVPTTLLKVQADMMAYDFDLKRDVKSESILSHSYTRNVRQNPEVQYARTVAKYVGPRGTAHRPGVIV